MPPVFTYTQGDPPRYTCTLHAARCAARGCREQTVVHPVCPRHARRVFGVELRPTQHGCGLFATRAFRRNQLIAPYLGRRFYGRVDGAARGRAEALDLTCPRCVPSGCGGAARVLSPYAVRWTQRQTADATCWRSWASMANHPDAGGPGANAVLKRLRVATGGFPAAGPDGDAVLRHRTRRYYLSQAVLGGASRPRAFGLDRDEVWLRAVRTIAAGDPILVSYADGPDRSRTLRLLLGIPHRTVPALSTVCRSGADGSKKRA